MTSVSTPRVVLLTTNFGRGGSGAEHQMARVFAALAARGWDPVVIARTTGTDEDLDETLHVLRVGRAGTGPLRALQFTLAAARTTARLRPAVTVSLQLGSNPVAALLAQLIARRRIPSIVRLTGFTANGSQLEARGRSWPVRVTTRFLLGRTTAVVAPAQHMLDQCGPFGPVIAPRARVVRNGAPQVEPTSARSPDAPVIWVGRDHPDKHPDHLLTIARRLPDVSFVALGLRPLPDDPPNLDRRGKVPSAAVLAEVGAARALVSTSSREGVPNTLLEALALGTPIVAYAIDGNVEACEGIEEGARLVPTGDVAALGDALRQTLVDGKGVTGHVTRISDATDEWEDLLRTVLDGRPIPRASAD